MALLSAVGPVKSPIAAEAPLCARWTRFSAGAIRPASAALCQTCRSDAAGTPIAAYSSPSTSRRHDSSNGFRAPAVVLDHLAPHLVGEVERLGGVGQVALVGEDVGRGGDVVDHRRRALVGPEVLGATVSSAVRSWAAARSTSPEANRILASTNGISGCVGEVCRNRFTSASAAM